MNQESENLLDISNKICQLLSNDKTIEDVLPEIEKIETVFGRVMVSQAAAALLIDQSRYHESMKLANTLHSPAKVFVMAAMIKNNSAHKNDLLAEIKSELDVIPDDKQRDSLISILVMAYINQDLIYEAYSLVNKIKDKNIQANHFYNTLKKTKAGELFDIENLCTELSIIISMFDNIDNSEEARAYQYRLLAIFEAKHGLFEMALSTLNEIKVDHHRQQVIHAFKNIQCSNDDFKKTIEQLDYQPDPLEIRLDSVIDKIKSGKSLSDVLPDINGIKKEHDKVAIAQYLVEKLCQLNRHAEALQLANQFNKTDRLYILITIADHYPDQALTLGNEIVAELNSIENLTKKDELIAMVSDIYSKHGHIKDALDLVNKISDTTSRASYFYSTLRQLKTEDRQYFIDLSRKFESLIDQMEQSDENDDEKQYNYRLLAVLFAINGFEIMANDALAKITDDFHKQIAMIEIMKNNLNLASE